MASGRRLPLAQAAKLAKTVVDAIRPFCRQVEIAGSIRRERPECGDIDIVCIPAGAEGRHRIIERCSRHAVLLKNGEQYVEFRLSNGFTLDLWFARERQEGLFEYEPGNWGILLLARTGSVEHNVKLVMRAGERGLTFRPHDGIFRGNNFVAGETEESVFDALGMGFVPPHLRDL